MTVALDKKRFGPWALVTGASSGIGKEFAQQIAASGINIVLVARREDLLKEVGVEFSKRYGVEHRVVVLDVSREDFIGQLASAADDLDIGLVVSNAGTGNPGEFLKLDRQLLQATLRLSTMAHLDITHHFGAKLAKRRRGGLILAGAMGAENGVPCMANDGAAKAYVHSLGEALHFEFKPLGVYVTVLAAGFTNTEVIEKFGFDPKTMPMKPMSVEQCVSEALDGLRKNRSRVVPGRLNRIMNALVPASFARKLEADLLGKGLPERPHLPARQMLDPLSRSAVMSPPASLYPTPHGRSGSAQSHRHGTAHPHARWVDGSRADRVAGRILCPAGFGWTALSACAANSASGCASSRAPSVRAHRQSCIGRKGGKSPEGQTENYEVLK